MRNVLLILSLTIYFQNLTAQKGLIGEYFKGKNFNEKVAIKVDDKIKFSWYREPFSGIELEKFSVKWTGKLIPPETGKYLIGFVVDDGVKLFINNKPILDAWQLNNKVFYSKEYFFEKGKPYDVVILYFNGMLEGEIDFKWQLPSNTPKLNGFFGTNEETIQCKYFGETNFNKPIETKSVSQPKTALKNNIIEKKPAIATPKKQISPPKDSIIKYIPKNILFKKSTSIMIGNSEKELKDLSVFLKKHPHLKVKINGHTDIYGDSALNVKLSEQRALAVKNYLILIGINANRLSSEGFGFNKPIKSVLNKNGNNRRVEFIIE